ncbi:MAG: acyl carrier protein [Proteobacteria bacterium]|nr:acyl carrier protein [Pseudomonadota bacterium]
MNESADYIQTVVTAALRGLLPVPAELSDSTNIVRDLGLDSVTVMDFVMETEERLDVSVPLDRISAVETIGDLVATLYDLECES